MRVTKEARRRGSDSGEKEKVWRDNRRRSRGSERSLKKYWKKVEKENIKKQCSVTKRRRNKTKIYKK